MTGPLDPSLPSATRWQEINFLEYRLHVIDAWPDSARKDGLRNSVLYRLRALQDQEPSGAQG